MTLPHARVSASSWLGWITSVLHSTATPRVHCTVKGLTARPVGRLTVRCTHNPTNIPNSSRAASRHSWLEHECSARRGRWLAGKLVDAVQCTRPPHSTATPRVHCTVKGVAARPVGRLTVRCTHNPTDIPNPSRAARRHSWLDHECSARRGRWLAGKLADAVQCTRPPHSTATPRVHCTVKGVAARPVGRLTVQCTHNPTDIPNPSRAARRHSWLDHECSARRERWLAGKLADAVQCTRPACG